MVLKHPLCPQRIRKPPAGFNWLDHRLVRDGYIELLSHPAAALYLFLVTVADARGLSYYSDDSVMKRLCMDSATLYQARRDLVSFGLIAYRKPLYQVLALDGSVGPAPAAETPDIASVYRPAKKPSTGTDHKPSTGTAAKPSSGRGGMQSVKEILKTIMEDTP